MVTLALAVTGVVGLLAGTAFGWASRSHARWCPRCGTQLRCPVHEFPGWVVPLGDGNSGPGGPL